MDLIYINLRERAQASEPEICSKLASYNTRENSSSARYIPMLHKERYAHMVQWLKRCTVSLYITLALVRTRPVSLTPVLTWRTGGSPD